MRKKTKREPASGRAEIAQKGIAEGDVLEEIIDFPLSEAAGDSLGELEGSSEY